MTPAELRDLMRRQGWTQRDLASLLPLRTPNSTRAIRYWLTGERRDQPAGGGAHPLAGGRVSREAGVKCLTVCQPWPWGIIHGQKRVENRGWPTKYRGPIAIHAGKSKAWLQDTLPDGTKVPLRELEFGKIIGIVDLVDCVPVDQVADDPFAYGPWCWVLADPRPLAHPIPYKGQLGLFEVPDNLFSAPPPLIAETPVPAEHRKYRPSNGTIGMSFMSEFCDKCAVRSICRILPKVMTCNVDDPQYPEQWTYDAEGNPTCTSFTDRTGRRLPRACLKTADLFAE